MIIQSIQSCIDACLQCFAECESCLDQFAASPEMAACAKLCRDCKTTCSAGADLLPRHSEVYAKVCGLCIKACHACAVECGQYETEECRRCAAACLRCAEECEQAMAAASRSKRSVVRRQEPDFWALFDSAQIMGSAAAMERGVPCGRL